MVTKSGKTINFDGAACENPDNGGGEEPPPPDDSEDSEPPTDGGGGDDTENPPPDETDPPDDGTPDDGGSEPEEPAQCKDCLFDCPEWDKYMGKVDDIIDKIPPPPNWSDMTDQFNEDVVPKLVDDLEDMLGEAPEPPSLPSVDMPDTPDMPDEPPPLDDNGLSEQEPVMDLPDGLEEEQFDAGDLESAAEEIEITPDPTGGFDIGNPMESLDENLEGAPMPEESTPEPPAPPTEQPTAPPEAPVPDQEPAAPPTPEQEAPTPPIPEQGSLEQDYYKQQPSVGEGSNPF